MGGIPDVNHAGVQVVLVLNEVFRHTLVIAGFVFVMMVVVEYLNVVTRGAWQKTICRSARRQYSIASLLGAIPGCLGAFASVTLYTHRVLSFGALVACMIATSGDEAFVMLALFPGKAVLLIGVMLLTGLVVGPVTDSIRGTDMSQIAARCSGLEIHEEHLEEFFCRAEIWRQLRKCSLQRGVLMIGLALFILALASGEVGPEEWNWIRVTFMLLSAVGLVIAATVPEHFLEEHLWNHVAREHLPRILLWTFGALLVVHLGTNYMNVETWTQYRPLSVLLIACLVGLIPESGPHLVFVTLFSQGLIPFSVLLASAIVQDGHGMLPLLAHSRGDFVKIKGIKFAVGLAVGILGYLLRF